MNDLDHLLFTLRSPPVLAARQVDLDNLPKFGGEPPEDQAGVLSWDEERVLVLRAGRGPEIMQRNEWGNERSWRITSEAGADMGVWRGMTKAEALAGMLREAGYEVDYDEGELLFQDEETAGLCGYVMGWHFDEVTRESR